MAERFNREITKRKGFYGFVLFSVKQKETRNKLGKLVHVMRIYNMRLPFKRWNFSANDYK